MEENNIVNVSETPYKLKFGQKVYVFIKSILDWLFALVCVVVFSPLWLVLFIAIKVDSKGPAIFSQERIGKNRKPFKCCKWRSMSVSAPHDTATRDLENADAYITKVGHFIRKTSLDELGQLFNVLTFKMSFIGYRPLLAKETVADELRFQKGVYKLKPGITGWAQVHGRDLIDDLKKAEYDEYYLRNVSLWLDIKIFFLTVKKVFKEDDIHEGVITDEKSAPTADEVAATDNKE